MKILHITPHMGGGVGTVIMDWMDNVNPSDHRILCLDSMNDKAFQRLTNLKVKFSDSDRWNWRIAMDFSDIILVHWWDHPMLQNWIKSELPPCRLVFWCHKNYPVPDAITKYPDRFIVTSPIQGSQYDCIKSTGNMERFLKLEKVQHEGFNVGTVWSKKMDISQWISTSQEIIKVAPNVRFTMLGDIVPMNMFDFDNILWLGKVPDIFPYLTEMDVFGYPLRPDHYGTSEIVLGEAMAAGLPVVCMDNPCERLIVKEGVTGFLCKTEQEYVENIEHLYHKPILRKWMGENAREAARVMYNLDDMVDKWNWTFEQMMKEDKKEHRL
jgi:L-malate glycosyltransferase